MIHKKFRFGRRRKKIARRRKACTFILFFKHFTNLTEINHPSEKKNIKKYLYLGEGENIRGKNKNLYIYCVLEQFIHILEYMHSLEKKTKNY